MKLKWLCCCNTDDADLTESQNTPKPLNFFVKINEVKPPIKSLSNFTKLIVDSSKENPNSFISRLASLARSDTNFPTLVLIVTESKFLDVNTEFTIFPNLLSENSKITYIGKNNPDLDNEILVSSTEEIKEKKLCIFFECDIGKFFLKDMCLSTFVKITAAKCLEKPCFISFIDKRVLIALNSKGVSIKIIETDEEFEFAIEDSPVVLGRGEGCDVKVIGKNISREQCTVYYEDKWYIKDGNLSNSRNGTWFIPLENSEIVDGMIFNAGKTVFSVSLRW